jgi:hypothetical protein
MDPENIGVGDVVQIDPTHDVRFGGCFLVVTKVRAWWVAGYVTIPGGREVYYRIDIDAIARIGAVGWVSPQNETIVEGRRITLSRTTPSGASRLTIEYPPSADLTVEEVVAVSALLGRAQRAQARVMAAAVHVTERRELQARSSEQLQNCGMAGLQNGLK